jgi:CBS-domain-containing membrane protein
MLGITAVAALAHYTGHRWIMPAFGSSCAILFGAPWLPAARPHRAMGGHLLSMTVAILFFQIFGNQWWVLGLAVGTALLLMVVLDLYHPPAGADPLAMIFLDRLEWDLLLMPVAAGTAVILTIAIGFSFLRRRFDPEYVERMQAAQ